MNIVFALAWGGTLTCPILTGEGYGADISYRGTKVLTYLGAGYGWGYEATPAEQEKSKEFYEIYFNEYRSVKNGEGKDISKKYDMQSKRIAYTIDLKHNSREFVSADGEIVQQSHFNFKA